MIQHITENWLRVWFAVKLDLQGLIHCRQIDYNILALGGTWYRTGLRPLWNWTVLPIPHACRIKTTFIERPWQEHMCQFHTSLCKTVMKIHVAWRLSCCNYNKAVLWTQDLTQPCVCLQKPFKIIVHCFKFPSSQMSATSLVKRVAFWTKTKSC